MIAAAWRRMARFARRAPESAEACFTRYFRDQVRVRTLHSTSASGRGSDLEHTAVVRASLPPLLHDLDAHRLLDVPCGDLHWMRHVALPGVHYIGADIVADLVAALRQEFAADPTREFRHLDLIADPLPRVDVILCRDGLVHLPLPAIARAVRNIKASRATYLLTTTFPQHDDNRDIRLGEWRPLNFELAPFRWGPPLRCLNEGYTGDGGQYPDKSLGLWRIADLPT